MLFLYDPLIPGQRPLDFFAPILLSVVAGAITLRGFLGTSVATYTLSLLGVAAYSIMFSLLTADVAETLQEKFRAHPKRLIVQISFQVICAMTGAWTYFTENDASLGQAATGLIVFFIGITLTDLVGTIIVTIKNSSDASDWG